MKYLPFLHILCMATALTLVLSAVYVSHGRKAGWFILHRRLALIGVLSALIAFTSEFTFKALMHYQHFGSPHSIAGVVTLMLLVGTAFLGLRIPSDPKMLRKTHRVLGRITAVAIVLTALMGIARFVQLSRN